MFIFASLFGTTPSGRHINKDAELAFICGYRNLANSKLCRGNAMVIVPGFGMYCSIQYIVPKAWADALLILHSWAMREPLQAG